MGHALNPPTASSGVESHPKLTWQDGAYHYTIDHPGGKSVYTVTDGAKTIALPIHWVFGANSQTFLLEYGGHFYESRASYYKGIDALDLTMGDQKTHPQTIVEAMGREVTPHEALTCFQCHATGAVAGDHMQLESLVPGVQCEHCHVGASRHLQAISQGKLEAVPPKLGRLTSEDTSNFCGQCHRSWTDVVRSRLFGQANVRFQPYRLANSKCFDGSDARISCTGCHDPHQEVTRNVTAYDAKCQACHVPAGATAAATNTPVCHVATSGCVSCHMPKVELPGGHQVFTDHFIRVVRANDAYPN